MSPPSVKGTTIHSVFQPRKFDIICDSSLPHSPHLSMKNLVISVSSAPPKSTHLFPFLLSISWHRPVLGIDSGDGKMWMHLGDILPNKLSPFQFCTLQTMLHIITRIISQNENLILSPPAWNLLMDPLHLGRISDSLNLESPEWSGLAKLSPIHLWPVNSSNPVL